MMKLAFEWDEAKARSNEQKHDVTFEEARTVFGDVWAIFAYDGPHSWHEDRSMIIGTSELTRVLTVIYVERTEMTMRIISARRATARERRLYEEKIDY
jgi:uncharacterized DUF497 family protein